MTDNFVPRVRVRADFQKAFDLDRFPGRTKQADVGGTNLKKIVERYRETGTLPPFARRAEDGVYADFSNADDYLAMTQRVLDAQAAFDGLPASLRDHFNNSPAQLLEAWHDPERHEELIELGAMEKPEEVPPNVDAATGEVRGETDPIPDPPADPPPGT